MLRLHQRDASLDARERLGAAALRVAERGDAVALLTCHRVELYATIAATADPREAFALRLRSADLLLTEAGIACDRDAALHLFRVAAGLDSAILGEGQIARQVRRVHDEARGRGLDPLLAGLFQRALRLARELRATTALGAVRRSVGSLAVDEALRHLPGTRPPRALIVGAGEIGKLAARALARRVGTLVIANRDPMRAREVAGPIGATAVGLDGLVQALADADAVISAADTRGALLTRDVLEERTRRGPLVLVDIAVPRSVSEDSRRLPGLVYRDVDHLAEASSALPQDVVAEAERRCAAEADAFIAWTREREGGPTIGALRARADAIRQRQLERALRRLGHLSPRDREVVRALAGSLTHALLHEPTVRARRDPEARRAARVLFGVGE